MKRIILFFAILAITACSKDNSIKLGEDKSYMDGEYTVSVVSFTITEVHTSISEWEWYYEHIFDIPYNLNYYTMTDKVIVAGDTLEDTLRGISDPYLKVGQWWSSYYDESNGTTVTEYIKKKASFKFTTTLRKYTPPFDVEVHIRIPWYIVDTPNY